MQPKQLSEADSQVLAQVFNPESGPAKAAVLVNPDLPADSQVHDEGKLELLRAREREAIAMIEQAEMAGLPAASQNKAYLSALAILDDLISTEPHYASAWNNRAQLRRWKFGDRNTLCQPKSGIDRERCAAGVAALKDLKACIDLASPGKSYGAVSPSQGRLLAQAYTQLAALYHAGFRDLDSPSIMEVTTIDGSRWSRDSFEDEASRCFYLGGLYGNEVAKALAVHTNPHAKLCGAIVKEAMRKELAACELRT